MYRIKLNATSSTNSYLRKMLLQQKLENFTTVCADNQTGGKGQRGSNWYSESGKNLTFSTVITDFEGQKFSPFLLNIIVAISLIEALSVLKIKRLSIKWPNDILSGNKKIAGILIENSFKSVSNITAIIGVGLNVNQLNFENLPNASSLLKLTNKEFNKEEILETIMVKIQLNYDLLNKKDPSYFWDRYHEVLFRKDVPAVFNTSKNDKFQGIVRGVDSNGKLVLQLEDKTQQLFDVKEISFCF